MISGPQTNAVVRPGRSSTRATSLATKPTGPGRVDRHLDVDRPPPVLELPCVEELGGGARAVEQQHAVVVVAVGERVEHDGAERREADPARDDDRIAAAADGPGGA